jgi:CheY-like chemotaxis protein
MPENTVTVPLRVLVVDDWPDATAALAALVRLWGHDVRMAYDGPTALEVAAHYQPNVVLLDIGLPGMDGFQVARRLRADLHLEATFLVSLTGDADKEAQQRSREAGCDRHIVKPVDPTVLERLLRTCKELQPAAEGAPPETAPSRDRSPIAPAQPSAAYRLTELAETRLSQDAYLALENISCEYRRALPGHATVGRW